MRLVVVASVVLAASTIARADFRNFTSPGPLSAGHAELDAKCDSCHVPFKGIPAERCLVCHAPVKARIASGQGLHARAASEGKKCSACHTDHRGRAAQITPAVARAGFDHALQTGIALDGKHAQAACTGCHKPASKGGAPRWLGIPAQTACASCHADIHVNQKGGTLGSDCARCHTPRGWKPPTKTLTDHKVSMEGGHAGLRCASCHAKGAALKSTSSCGDCHEQAHGGTTAPCAKCHNTRDWKQASFTHDFCSCILPGKHQTAPCLSCHVGFKFKPTPFACAACHTKDRKHEELGACSRCHSALSWKTKTFDHNAPRVGFALDGKHLEVGCENCHTRPGLFRGAPRACEGCHKVPAHGDFGGCAKCHTTAGFSVKQNFSHDQTRFPLDNKHAQVKCQDCHSKFPKGSFVPGPNACVLCHASPHGTQFGRAPSPLRVLFAANGPLPATTHVVSPGRGCTDCHTTARWSPSTIDAARHATFGFALRGAHARTACAMCHEGGRFVGTPQRCADCHMDRHKGKLGDRCESCHDEERFRAPPGFDHRVTGFPLENSHAGVACASCHGARHDRLATVANPTCATCHTPAHGDQFGRDCATCHKTTKFRDVARSFDHSRTHFPLDRRHAALRCTACHDGSQPRAPQPICRSCHGDPHRGRTLLDCGECHRADRWTLVRFDHDRTIFPLRGRHFTTPCRDCHTNDLWTGLRAECVSCHRGDRQTADANLAFHRTVGIECGDCHKPFGWKAK
jgi:hypothetical protein